MGSELIRVLAVDADVGNNSLVLYNILGIRFIKQHSNDSQEVANIFSIGGCPACWGGLGQGHPHGQTRPHGWGP